MTAILQWKLQKKVLFAECGSCGRIRLSFAGVEGRGGADEIRCWRTNADDRRPLHPHIEKRPRRKRLEGNPSDPEIEGGDQIQAFDLDRPIL